MRVEGYHYGCHPDATLDLPGRSRRHRVVGSKREAGEQSPAGLFMSRNIKIRKGPALMMRYLARKNTPYFASVKAIISGEFGPVPGIGLLTGRANGHKPLVVSFVSSLLGKRNPFAVFRIVTLINVNAFNRESLSRHFAHIGKECFKRVFPFFANGNPPAAIVFVAGAIRVKTAVFHSTPCSVFRGFPHAVGNFVEVLSAEAPA